MRFLHTSPQINKTLYRFSTGFPPKCFSCSLLFDLLHLDFASASPYSIKKRHLCIHIDAFQRPVFGGLAVRFGWA